LDFLLQFVFTAIRRIQRFGGGSNIENNIMMNTFNKEATKLGLMVGGQR
jgi:hypothetical protein